MEIGYAVTDAYRGKGHATRALGLAVRFAQKFAKPVILKIRDDNIASQRVAKKNGFHPSDHFVWKDYPVAGAVKLRTYSLSDETGEMKC